MRPTNNLNKFCTFATIWPWSEFWDFGVNFGLNVVWIWSEFGLNFGLHFGLNLV